MNSSYHYYSSTSFFYSTSNDQTNTPNHHDPIRIPIESPTDETLTSIPIRFPSPDPADAAVKIQSAFRGHLTRSLVGKIRAVDSEAERFERLIQRQETVDAVRRDDRERIRLSEGLMAALLRLDSVPGFYSAVRELRRAVSRRIVGIQEVFDAIVAAPTTAMEEAEGIPASLGEIVAGIWGKERGDEEESARGFGCWERFLGRGSRTNF
ncbi:BAG family molecular chaperone regulator 5, mitochondrial-like [Typha latifolia]|uniref:BAG family molecular chaperone regulator 5, mitochondrial-like n=1 Tax=Typha latifolia TaxID=4733 RepID=UPI003C3050D5